MVVEQNCFAGHAWTDLCVAPVLGHRAGGLRDGRSGHTAHSHPLAVVHTHTAALCLYWSTQLGCVVCLAPRSCCLPSLSSLLLSDSTVSVTQHCQRHRTLSVSPSTAGVTDRFQRQHQLSVPKNEVSVTIHCVTETLSMTQSKASCRVTIDCQRHTLHVTTLSLLTFHWLLNSCCQCQ